MIKPIVLVALLFLNFPYLVAEQKGDGCQRGDAEKVFPGPNAAIKSESFNKKSRTEAVEQVTLTNGDKITIKNWGCEYYVLSFRYESKSISPKNPTPQFWFQKSAEILKKLPDFGSQALFDEELAAKQLSRIVDNKEELKLGEQIKVEGDGSDFLQSQVTVKEGGAGFVEFDLLKGPL